MQHVIRFEGSFERNFAALRPGVSEYEGEDGARCEAAPWPTEADGVRFGFMEQRGKRFLAVRVQYGEDEIVLRHPVRLDAARHLGGRRFSARPIPLADEPAGTLLADILDLNPEQRPELTALRERVRRALARNRAHRRMSHPSTRPFAEYRDTPLWRALTAVLADLEESRELAVATAPEYVVGYLCRELAAKKVVSATALTPDLAR